MEDLVRQFIYTVGLRPYFFLFFLAYVVGGSFHLGFLRTLVFAVVGFAVAWTAEHSSIHTGFPFGLYHYTEYTKGRELWAWDVPLIDSMSFVFLAWASYSMALLSLRPLGCARFGVRLSGWDRIKQTLPFTVLGSLLFVYLDIVIDPVALRGERWFLGRLYYYPEPGIYFGVPLSNFLGWLLVGFVLIGLLQLIERLPGRGCIRDRSGGRFGWRYAVGPALYLGVLVFNLFMTFHIGEYLMGVVGIFLFLLPCVLLSATIWARSFAALSLE